MSGWRKEAIKQQRGKFGFTAEEEAIRKKAEEVAAKKRADEETARKKAEEVAARKKEEEEFSAGKRAKRRYTGPFTSNKRYTTRCPRTPNPTKAELNKKKEEEAQKQKWEKEVQDEIDPLWAKHKFEIAGLTEKQAKKINKEFFMITLRMLNKKYSPGTIEEGNSYKLKIQSQYLSNWKDRNNPVNIKRRKSIREEIKDKLTPKQAATIKRKQNAHKKR